MPATKSTFLLCLVLAIAACTSPPLQQMSKLKQQTLCCDNLSQIEYQNFNEKGNYSFTLGKKPYVRMFDEGKSYFEAIRLPDYRPGSMLALKCSMSMSADLVSRTVTSPMLLYLNESFEVTRKLDVRLGYAYDAWAGEFIKGYAPLSPDDKYILVYADGQYNGKYVRTGYAPIALTPEGRVSLKVADRDESVLEKAGVLTNRLNPGWFSMPERVAGYGLAEVTEYDHLSAGFQSRYQSERRPTVIADVFVYPVVYRGNTSFHYLLDEEYQRFLHEIKGLSKEGVATVKPLKTKAVHLDNRSMIHSKLMINYKESGESRLSHVFLTATEVYYIKVRFSYPVKEESVGEAERFAKSVVAHVQTVPEVEFAQFEYESFPNQKFIDVERQFPGITSPWHEYINYLSDYQKENGLLSSFDRELEARRALIGAWRVYKQSQSANADIDFFNEMEAIDDSGYLKEYVWDNFRKGHWLKPRNLDMEGFNTWLEINLAGHKPVERPTLYARPKNTQIILN